MTSIFLKSRLEPAKTNIEEPAPIFQSIKRHKEENIIPPIGIAKPELVESFLQNLGDEEAIKRDIAEAERYEKENIFETAGRETLAHTARGAEGFLGGINSFLNILNPDLELEEESGEVERFQPKKLPGPNELHEFTKSQTGKYLEPKNEFTKSSQEIASDIGSMFSTPGLGPWSKILLPIGGQIVKQGIKGSGAGETAQEIGKLGFMSLASIANLGNAPKVASMALTRAEQMLPQGLQFTARPTEQALQRIKNLPWYRTGSTPSKGPAMAEIERIEQRIQNGMIDAHDFTQLRRDVNEARRQLGGFQLNKPVNRRQALKYLDDVDNALLASGENYGKNVNPNWWKQYSQANEAFRVTQRSRLISDFVEQHAKPLRSELAKTLFHVGAATTAHALPTLGTLALPGVLTAKSIQIMNRMIHSPVLRNHYVDVLTHAASGNSAAMNKSLEKLDAIANKLESKNAQKSK